MFVMFVPAQHVQLSGSMPLVLQVRNARVSYYKRVGILLHISVSESVCVGQEHAIFCCGECEKAAIHMHGCAK